MVNVSIENGGLEDFKIDKVEKMAPASDSLCSLEGNTDIPSTATISVVSTSSSVSSGVLRNVQVQVTIPRESFHHLTGRVSPTKWAAYG